MSEPIHHAAAPANSATTSDFAAWAAEREQIAAALKTTPESDEPAHDSLIDRSYALERLIIETPAPDLPGLRVKAELLTWYMEMERADGVEAMRHIRDYLARQA